MIRFSEIEYRRPDFEALKSLLTDATQKVREAKSFAEVTAIVGLVVLRVVVVVVRLTVVVVRASRTVASGSLVVTVVM